MHDHIVPGKGHLKPIASYGAFSGLLKFVCIIVLATVPIVGFAGKGSSRWVTTPVIIDGNNDEWPQPYSFTEEVDTRMQYAIANDATTLYLTIKTSDETTKMKLKLNGLTIFVDTTGRKMMPTSFGFSVLSNVKPAPRHRGKGEKTQDNTGSEDSATAAQNAKKLDIAGVQIIGTESYDGNYNIANNKAGISAAAAVNDYNELVWEIAIPFKCLFANAEKNVEARKKISVCFTVYGLSNNDIFDLTRSMQKENQNAMPVMHIDSSRLHSSPGDKDAADNSDEGGAPVRGANGGTGVGIGGGKGKGKGGGGSSNDAQVIDAVAAMQDRQRAAQTCLVWKAIKISYKP